MTMNANSLPSIHYYGAMSTSLKAVLTSSFTLSCVSSEEDIQTQADLNIISTHSFDHIEDCKVYYFSLAEPVLILANQEETPDVLHWLRISDDICLVDTPSDLLVHRIHKLLNSKDNFKDALTDLFNRQYFLAQLELQLKTTLPLSLILIDFDNFKGLNDQYGHAVGDQVLQEFAALLLGIFNHEGVIARFGGEAFAILCPADDEAINLAERIRFETEQASFANQVKLTVSVGVSIIYEPLEPNAFIKQADEALYAAKAGGRNLVVSYDDLMQVSNELGEDLSLLSFEHRAKVYSERVTSFITQRSKRILRAARQEAEIDGLTQVYTRRYLDKRLAREFENAAKHQRALCVALIDVDHFGQVNKTHGWPTGDKVLKNVCNILRSQIRSTDWLGRYGGEEFCLVMPDTTLEQGHEILERLRETVAASAFTSTAGESISITMSVGVVEHQMNDRDVSELLERASQATLQAKQQGRNRVVATTKSPL